MKKLTIILTLILMSFAAPAIAEHGAADTSAHANEQTEGETKDAHTLKSGDALVNVNGLVCDFCARALEKVFSKEAAVEAIDVNLDTKIITIFFNDGQTMGDEQITQLITDSGYNVEGINRVE